MYKQGYSSNDIVVTLFRVVKLFDLDEGVKLDFIKVIGLAHVKVLEGVDSFLQLTAIVANLCKVGKESKV